MEEKQVIVDELDKLRMVNQHLQVLTLMQEEQLIRSEFLRLQEQRSKVQEKLNKLNVDIKETIRDIEMRYGVNLSTHEIRESDGAVIPRGNANLLEQMQKQLAAKPQG